VSPDGEAGSSLVSVTMGRVHETRPSRGALEHGGAVRAPARRRAINVTSFDPAELERRDVARLINAIVAPRPIAWVSSIGPEGIPNLAPFSFFNAFCTSPPTVAIGPGSRSGVSKDSLTNIRASGEFVVSAVSESLALSANRTSAEFGPEVDEWELAGVTAAPSETVAPARVAESPASLECRVFEVVDLGSESMPTNSIVIARVTRIHVVQSALDGTVPRADALALVGRAGGDLWVRTAHTFALRRPSSDDPAEVAIEGDLGSVDGYDIPLGERAPN
jgi:flavin reductase (DIM6/NTAB) family NADH-FMN oxidoreductase RutF